MNVAQTADIFYSAHGRGDAAGTVHMLGRRAGRWFDPDVVKAFCSVVSRGSLWADVDNAALRVNQLEPRRDFFDADDAFLDNICLAFADVIDAKSPFTFRHSAGVAAAAFAIAQYLDLSSSEVATIRRAALLHDIGKLSVSNTILDKPDRLTNHEWSVVRRHPYHSQEILRRIPGFRDLSEIAASHHEKLDGSGYFRNMSARHLSLPARILVVADIYDALAAKRPYRDALPIESVLGIIAKEVPRALDASCFEALKECSATETSADLLSLSSHLDETHSECLSGVAVPCRSGEL